MKHSFFTQENIRLDQFMRAELPSRLSDSENSSNSKIRRLIVAGAVFVNGVQIRRPAYVLKGRSSVDVFLDEEKFFYEKTPDDIEFELEAEDVLFEDEFLIVVNKPVPFPTEETIVGGRKRDSLHDAVVRHLWKKNPDLRNPPYVGIMHRLDRETSGVILFTKQRSVNKDVQAMFENRSIRKIYVALCTPKNGNKDFPKDFPRIEVKNPSATNSSLEPEKSFTVEKYMGRISPKSQAAKWGTLSRERGGLYSRTDFAVLGTKKILGQECVFVRAELHTGRTHQIRVHLGEAGLPILGDELYGGRTYRRIMLHSMSLEFTHPVSAEKIKVECEPPF